MARTTTRVPKLTGALAGAHYSLIAMAQDSETQDTPSTLAWMHDVNVASTVALSSWLPAAQQHPGVGRDLLVQRGQRRDAAGGRDPGHDRQARLVDHDLRRLDVVHAARAVARSAAGRDADVPGVRAADPRRSTWATSRSTTRATRSPASRTTSSPSPAERAMHTQHIAFTFTGLLALVAGACGSNSPLPHRGRAAPDPGRRHRRRPDPRQAERLRHRRGHAQRVVERVGARGRRRRAGAVRGADRFDRARPVRFRAAAATPDGGASGGAGCGLLTKAVTLTVSASGHAPSTWIGVDGSNVTIALRAISAPALGRATVMGTIAGWDACRRPPRTTTGSRSSARRRTRI